MPRYSMVLLAAALLCPALAAAQSHTAPRKQTHAVARGMTPAQVRQVLGEPVRVRREGTLTYMEYPNGCRGCSNDFVVVSDCRVVAAQFGTPARQLIAAPVPDGSAPPPEECRVSASDPGPAPGAIALTSTAPPQDAGPVGMAPAQPAVTRPEPATVPEPPMQEGTPDQWRRRLTLRRPATHVLAVPAASITSPTAFGMQMGEGYVGFAYQARTRYTHIDDGAAGVGIGLGDRQRYVGVEVDALSYSTLRGGGPLETGGLSFKVHRAFGDRWGAAVGWENAVSWGGSDAGNSPYGVVTRIFRLRDESQPLSAVAASLGVGGGRFRSEDNIADDRGGANVFGALGVQVAEPLSVVADWTGQDLYAGVSVSPVRRVPLVINAGFADLTGSAGNGTRFVASASLGFRWLPPYFF